MSERYILDENKNAIRCDDLIEWARNFEHLDKRVGIDRVNGKRISTVFLGIDHSFGSNDGPLLFETMVFKDNGYDDIYCERYKTYNEAVTGHNRVIELVKTGKINENQD